jgi:hypothetical protein
MSAEITWRSMPSAGMNHWRMSGITITEYGKNSDEVAESKSSRGLELVVRMTH